MRALGVTWRGGQVIVSEPDGAGAMVSSAFRRGARATVVGTVFGGRAGQTAAEALLDTLTPQGPAPLPNGDYAGVICTAERAYLFRDEQARVPLYLRLQAGKVVEAGTSLSMLDSARLPDCRYLCHYLVGVDAAQQHIRRTPFIDVQRVFAGEVVELSHDGTIVRRWQGRSDAAPANLDEQTAPAELRMVLRVAVANRLASTTGCHLSGGLDSTSVALLAADEMRRAGEGDLVLVSARYESGELADEADWINAAVAAVRRLYPATRTLTVSGEQVLDFKEFIKFAASTNEPYAQAFRAPLFSRLSEAAADAGCHALLTGCGADPVVDGTSLGLLRLVRRGHLLAAVNEADRWAQQTGLSRRDVALDSVVRPVMPVLLDWLRRVVHHDGQLAALGSYARAPWVRTAFARDHGYGAARRAEAHFRLGHDPERSLFIATNYISAPDPLSWAEATARGFLLSHPFLDRDLVVLMASLPAGCRSTPFKPILRSAMRDLLPELILRRVRKVPFNAVYAQGLRNNYPHLLELCRSASHPLVREVFDVDLLCQALREAALGAGDAVSTDRLNASLALLVWLDTNGLSRRA